MTEILNKHNESQRKEYEQFVLSNPKGNFMQSLNWAAVKENWDYEAVIVRNENGVIIGSALVLIRTIPYINKSFLYSPHGPVCDLCNENVLNQIMKGIEFIRKKYNGYEFMSDPFITESDTAETEFLINFGFRHKYDPPELSTIQARNNYIIKLNDRTKEDIFSSFHKKWRYNIRLAERKGVECRICGIEALDDFYPLMIETGKRDGFPIRSKDYFRKMLENLGEHCRLYICYYEDVPVSGAICVQYAGKTCYVYGASASYYRNVMPNYLMQWNMICWAIESSCEIYDFQGIPFYKDETHPNYGVYRFKSGFNGEIMTYAGEFSICYSLPAKLFVKFFESFYRKVFKRNPSELLDHKEHMDEIHIHASSQGEI